MYLTGGWLGDEQVASDEIYELNLLNFVWGKLIFDSSIGPCNMHSANRWGRKIVIFR
jgi:hypothetical protein